MTMGQVASVMANAVRTLRGDADATGWGPYTWGSTAAERLAPYPCDREVDAPDEAYFRAVDVDASPPVVFRWLCQLRAAPYSYDWIDNLGRESPRRLTPGLDALERGQDVMGVFRLVDFARDDHLTMVTRFAPFPGIAGAVAVTYAVRRGLAARSRIVVKLVIRYPRGSVGWLIRALLPAGDLVMMRKQLLTLKALAEADAATTG
jgi:hypothetical protein